MNMLCLVGISRGKLGLLSVLFIFSFLFQNVADGQTNNTSANPNITTEVDLSLTSSPSTIDSTLQTSATTLSLEENSEALNTTIPTEESDVTASTTEEVNDTLSTEPSNTTTATTQVDNTVFTTEEIENTPSRADLETSATTFTEETTPASTNDDEATSSGSTSTAQPPSNTESTANGLSGEAIAAIVIGTLALSALLTIIVVRFVQKRKRQQEYEQPDDFGNPVSFPKSEYDDDL